MFPAESLPEAPLTIEQAIARFEGWYARGDVPNRPQRCNNPGNINYGDFAQHYGATGGDPRFAIFPGPEEGWACLAALLRTPAYQALTVEGAIMRYAPPGENQTDNYITAICQWCECQRTDMLRDVLR